MSYDGWHLRSQHRLRAQVPTARLVCSESEFLSVPKQIMNLLPFSPRFIAFSSCELRKQVVVHSSEGRLGNEVDFRARLFWSRSSSADNSSKMPQHSFSTTLNTRRSVLIPSHCFVSVKASGRKGNSPSFFHHTVTPTCTDPLGRIRQRKAGTTAAP